LPWLSSFNTKESELATELFAGLSVGFSASEAVVDFVALYFCTNGMTIATTRAITAITTISSTSVKPLFMFFSPLAFCYVLCNVPRNSIRRYGLSEFHTQATDISWTAFPLSDE
jgi:hypothetical protein